MKSSLPISRVTTYRLDTKPARTSHRQTRRSGTAVLVVLVIISILMVYVAGNLRTLDALGKQLKLIEKKQEQRLKSITTTNTPSAIPSATRKTIERKP